MLFNIIQFSENPIYSFGMPMPGRTYSATATEPASLSIPWGGIDGYSGGELLTNCEDNFTIELWVKPTSTHEVDQVFAGNDGINGQKYVIDPPQALYFNNSWTDAGAGISVGTNGVSIYEHNYGYIPAVLVCQGDVINWTHIALVYENKIPKLYINGNLVGTGVTSPKTHVYPGTLVGSGVFGTMNGEVDEVRIWNTVRTQQQIQENMNKSVATPQTNLEAYWPIKTGEITNLQDISGNSHNVVLPTGNNYGSYSNGSGSTAPLSGDYYYRYGFNGKENDNEVKGTGNQTDFGARPYDPRLGRWFSPDKLTRDAPAMSPFAFADNSPIAAMDPDGNRTYFIGGAGYNPNKGRLGRWLESKKFPDGSFTTETQKAFKEILGDEFQMVQSSSRGMIRGSYWSMVKGSEPILNVANDKVLKAVVLEIVNDYNHNNKDATTGECKPLNLMGSSYGSVVTAQTAIEILDNYDTYHIDYITSITLSASTIADNSPLYDKLQGLQAAGKLGQIIPDPNPGDKVTGAAGKSPKEGRRNFFKLIGHTKVHNEAAADKNRAYDRMLRKTVGSGTEGDDNQAKAQELIKEKTGE